MAIIATPTGKIEVIGRIYTETWKNGAGWWSWHVVSADGQRLASDCHAETHYVAEREATRAYRSAVLARTELLGGSNAP